MLYLIKQQYLKIQNKLIKSRQKSFTLLECLVALFALSGSVLVISGLTQLIETQFIEASNDSQKDWRIFCEQMRAELTGATFDKIDHNFLYVTSDKPERFGLMGEDFRKTDITGRGYQPMLYQLKGTKISNQDNLVEIQVNFKQGGTHTFFYKFSNPK